MIQSLDFGLRSPEALVGLLILVPVFFFLVKIKNRRQQKLALLGVGKTTAIGNTSEIKVIPLSCFTPIRFIEAIPRKRKDRSQSHRHKAHDPIRCESQYACSR